MCVPRLALPNGYGDEPVGVLGIASPSVILRSSVLIGKLARVSTTFSNWLNADVLMLAREKFWLWMNTNYAEVGIQLLASQKHE